MEGRQAKETTGWVGLVVDSLGCDAVGIRWRSKAESDETRRNKRHTMATHRKRVKE